VGRVRKIVMVGGGLVGSLLSVMLGRRGYRVTVFEKRPDMRLKEISAGRSINLALAERGINALKKAELFDEVEPLLIPMRGRMLHPLGGEQEFSPYGQRPHEVIHSVSRGMLNQVMLTAAEDAEEVAVHFLQECTGVDLDKREIELLDHESGKKHRVGYDILLGTDGAASEVRSAIVRATGGSFCTEWLDHDYKELEIPAGPDGTFQIDKNSLHVWPRHGYMLIALPNLDSSFTVTLFLQKQGEPGFDRLDSPQAVTNFFHEQFPDALALIPELAQDFAANPAGGLGTIRCSKWTNGQDALILGDASHAIVPFHGQGMNAGFEDCALLTRLLDETGTDWPEAMSRFERERIADANAIADMALENYVTMRDTVLDPQFHLKKKIGFELEMRWPRRFIPRYSMVMFHNIPYHIVQQRGLVQNEILELVIANRSPTGEINWPHADSLVGGRLDEISWPTQ